MESEARIEIRRLRVKTFIGVPDEERADAQELRVSLLIEPRVGFAAMEDEIDRTIDYAVLAAGIQELALARPRKLIETLASDIAVLVLENPQAASVEVVLEKFILPQTDCVAVRLKASKDA
ncbi:dihydroneopterin aldolase [Luteolibacter sp. GHJ8]|uniref:dihydroneopterin aldolase n=1 Tax=Luteolibacter rhizosphaerae TaxID=2989719 RepID=A0ABT3G7I5_9BACT|nr:dihydroneopterin aldolase [Luteolibacter rhizosphaerae]MCW1915419.1 dihydroneopterin aldolase [Luteolibacter rhizosphaerae]